MPVGHLRGPPPLFTHALRSKLAHAQRFHRGYDRPFDMPDKRIDEAEASLDASFFAILSPLDRRLLIEDAREQLDVWLSGAEVQS